VTPALEIKNLTKRFGKITAVDNLSLSIEEGDVYGFLGPNGAGKTTTMAVCVNLMRPDAGEVRIFGKPVRKDFLEIFKDLGCLVEIPAYYPYLTGRANLEVLARAGGRLDRKETSELIELVGLGDAAKRKFGTYSTGMKARLALAGVLLGGPKLVILDEPTSGLDPAGVELVRDIFRTRNREKGVTFFISSHNLDEVERMCNKVALIDCGKLVACGEVKKLLTPEIERCRVECDKPAEAAEALEKLDLVSAVEIPDGEACVIIHMHESRPEEISRHLVEQGFNLHALTPHRLSLEEFFHQKLGRPITPEEHGKNLDRGGDSG